MSTKELEGHQDLFQELTNNLQLVIDKLKDGESMHRKEDGFDLEAFWSKINTFVKGLSAEATKLCLAFSSPPPPPPKDCQPIVEGLEKVTLAIVSTYYSLPTTKGLALQKSVCQAIVNTMLSLQSLITIIKTDGCQGAKSQLQSMGGVWQKCDNFPNLPKDNHAAVLTQCRSAAELVQDALEEIKQAVKEASNEEEEKFEDEEEDEEEEETWTPADKDLLSPAVALIKASKACIKKVSTAVRKNGSASDNKNIQDLDQIAEHFDTVSPLVDDLAASLYSPMNQEAVKSNADELVSSLTELLQLSKHSHITTEDDQSWVEFLLKATRHNQEKIHQKDKG